MLLRHPGHTAGTGDEEPILRGDGAGDVRHRVRGVFTDVLSPAIHRCDRSVWFPLPAHLQVHGLILSAWYGLFFLQSWLIATRRTSLHRRLGIVAVGLAGVVIASGLTVLRYISRAFAAGRTEAVVTNVVVNDAVALALFVAFVALGAYFRRRPEPHRRLMYFASIVIISPAFAGGRPLGQLFASLVPAVMGSWSDDLFIAFALVALVVRDYHRHGKVFVTTQWGAAAFVAANPTATRVLRRSDRSRRSISLAAV